MLLPLSLLIGWTASAKEDNRMLAKTAGCAVVRDRPCHADNGRGVVVRVSPGLRCVSRVALHICAFVATALTRSPFSCLQFSHFCRELFPVFSFRMVSLEITRPVRLLDSACHCGVPVLRCCLYPTHTFKKEADLRRSQCKGAGFS